VPLVPFGEELTVSTAIAATALDSGASSLSSACSTAPSSAPQASSSKGMLISFFFAIFSLRCAANTSKHLGCILNSNVPQRFVLQYLSPSEVSEKAKTSAFFRCLYFAPVQVQLGYSYLSATCPFLSFCNARDK
jgi:hypothetical protein